MPTPNAMPDPTQMASEESWLSTAIPRIEADFQRSADIHLAARVQANFGDCAAACARFQTLLN